MSASSCLRPLLKSINSTLVLLPCGLFCSSVALALPVPDATLGTQNTPLRPGAVQIDGGTAVGQNLFHSFDSFNINTNESVIFNSTADTNHIFSRITGTEESFIDGILGTQGSDADLFLMNPNGIIFGANASLDVQGSLVVTTADAIEFAETGSFGLAESETDITLLTVDPSAFLFSPGNTGSIENQSRADAGLTPDSLFSTFGLRVPDSRNLNFIGGNILNDGGGLVAFGGDISLVSVAETLAIEQQVEYIDKGVSLIPAAVRGNITHTNGAGSIVVAGDGGSISLYGNNIDITNGSFMNAGLLSNLGPENARAGNIVLDASETIRVTGDTALTTILNFLGPDALGIGGDIILRAQELNVSNGGQIATLNSGRGSTGDVRLEIPKKIVVNSSDSRLFTGIFAQVLNLASEAAVGGDILIETKNILIEDEGRIDSSTFGRGNSGDVLINAEQIKISGRGNFFSINDGTGIFLDVASGATGSTGNLLVETGTLTLENGGRVSVSTFGQGNAGKLEVNVADQLLINGQQGLSRIENDVAFPASGNANGINIQAGRLILQNSASIESQIQGTGNTAGISIDADSIALQENSQIQSQLQGNGSTKGITVLAEELQLENGSRINGSIISFGRGSTGDINIDVDDIVISGISFRASGVFLDNRAFISTNDDSTSQSTSGDIVLDVENLTLRDGGELSASILFGRGNAGKVDISASGQILLDGSENNSFIFNNIQSGGIGNTAGIFIDTSSLLISDGSQIRGQIEDSDSQGSIGAINIEANQMLLIGNDNLPDGRFAPSAIFSRILPDTEGRTAGIFLDVDSLKLADGAQISSTTSGIGDSGNIEITATGNITLSDSSILSEVTAASEIDFGEEITIGGGGGIAVPTGNAGNAGNAGSSSVNNSNGNRATLNNSEITASENDAEAEETGGIGNGGDIIISANRLELTDGSSLLADTESRGNAGKITLRLQDALILSGEGPAGIFRDFVAPSQISTSVDNEDAVGEGGDITIDSGSILIADGGFISSGTSGEGAAGDIIINVDSGISLVNGEIDVFSESASQAGNLSVTADRLSLNNKSLLNARSSTVNGGNINLDLDELLLLRNGSQITATAGTAQAQGNGGNVNIAVPFIVAIPSENSDITANAFEGAGGEVNVTANGVFGIEFRPALTPLSDITATSERGVNGVVTLNAPDTSFIQNDLTDLPDALTSSDSLVANSCVARSQDISGTFIVSGDTPANSPDSDIPIYTTGNIEVPDDTVTQHPNDFSIAEPSAVYQTTDGRLVMSRECL